MYILALFPFSYLHMQFFLKENYCIISGMLSSLKITFFLVKISSRGIQKFVDNIPILNVKIHGVMKNSSKKERNRNSTSHSFVFDEIKN